MIPLETIHIAKPCRADWDDMTGDAQVRHCGQCRKNVYNLSEMTRAQAEALLLEKEGRLCVRFYTRADGTILTQDCPVGLRAFRFAVARRLSLAAALVLSCLSGLGRGTDAARAVTTAPHVSQTTLGKPAVPAKSHPQSHPKPRPATNPRGWTAGAPRAVPPRAVPPKKTPAPHVHPHALMGRIVCPLPPPPVIPPRGR